MILFKKTVSSENIQRLAFLCISFVFIVLCSVAINRILPQGDDGILGQSSYAWSQSFIKMSLEIFQSPHLIMTSLHNGGTERAIVLPFYYFIDNAVLAAQFASVGFFLIGLYFFYSSLISLTTYRVAFSASLLMAVHPQVVFAVTHAVFYSALSWIFFATSLSTWSLLRWLEKRQCRYFHLLCFAIGFGLSSRIWFVWFIVANLIYFIIFQRDKLKNEFRLLIKTNHLFVSLAGFFFFMIGAFPLIFDNLVYQLITFKHLFSKLTETDTGVVNSNYLDNLQGIAVNYFRLLEDKMKYFILKPSSHTIFSFPIHTLLLCVSILFGVVFISNFSKKEKALIAYCLVLLMATFIQAPFTPTGLAAHHLMILFPYSTVLILLVFLENRVTFKMFQKASAFLVLLLFIASCGMTVEKKYQILKGSGAGEFSRVATKKMYEWVSSDMSDQKVKPIYSHNMYSAFFPLFGKKLLQVEQPVLLYGEISEETERELLDEKKVFLAGEECFERLNSIYEQHQLTIILLKYFYDYHGEKALFAYRLKRISS